MKTLEKRVVITGLGVISPVGIGKDAFWKALLNGESGIGPITHFDAAEYTTRIAGEVKDFDPADFGIDRKEARHMDPSTQYSVAAAKLALDDSKINLDEEDRDRIGTIIGTGIGGMETLHNLYKGLFSKGPSRVNPFVVPKMIANMASGQVSIFFGLQGHCASVVTACATGTNSIGDAYRMIQRGELDAALAGGTEAAVSPGAVAGFAAMKALSTRNDDPTHASRPFDKDRDGFVMGEGAGIVVLEELEHAKNAVLTSTVKSAATAAMPMLTTSRHRHRKAFSSPSAWPWLSKTPASNRKTSTTSMPTAHPLTSMTLMNPSPLPVSLATIPKICS